jgi:RimJ/RimL family protein N-acetyltransferase
MSGLPIGTPRLVIRNWRDSDRNLFHEINSDTQVMEFFPFRLERGQADELMDRLRRRIDETGLGFFAVDIGKTGECIGFTGLAQVDLQPMFTGVVYEIGWRLARRFWGYGYATEAANAVLDYGFAHFGLDEIIAFAIPGNRRSIAVMRRIGMRRDALRDFDHPRIPDTHPELRRHAVFAIGRENWKAARTASAGRLPKRDRITRY